MYDVGAQGVDERMINVHSSSSSSSYKWSLNTELLIYLFFEFDPPYRKRCSGVVENGRRARRVPRVLTEEVYLVPGKCIVRLAVE